MARAFSWAGTSGLMKKQVLIHIQKARDNLECDYQVSLNSGNVGPDTAVRLRREDDAGQLPAL